VPPPRSVKHWTILRYARRFGPRVFIETGTFRGDTVEAVRLHFDRICSIDLGQKLFEDARARFSAFPRITILQGDSGEILSTYLEKINEPCLFWLDGHYSEGATAKGLEDTPLMREIRYILSHPAASAHVILIDDARCLGQEPSWPTEAWLREASQAAGYAGFEVADDVVRITP
jgi:hypothetical protein